MSRTWFSRRGLTCESETFSIKTYSNADADLNGNRLLTTLDLVPGVSLAPIGSTPNANAASLSSSVLNMQPANASFGGVMTTGGQSIAGVKKFVSGLSIATGTDIFDEYTHYNCICTFTLSGGGGAYSDLLVNGIPTNANAFPVTIYISGNHCIVEIPYFNATITAGTPLGWQLSTFTPDVPAVRNAIMQGFCLDDAGHLQTCSIIAAGPDPLVIIFENLFGVTNAVQIGTPENQLLHYLKYQ